MIIKIPLYNFFWQEAGCFPCGSAGKESTCNTGDLGSIPGLGRSPGEGKGYSLQYSGLQNSMGCIVHEVTKSQTQLSKFHFHFQLSGKRVMSFAYLRLLIFLQEILITACDSPIPAFHMMCSVELSKFYTTQANPKYISML